MVAVVAFICISLARERGLSLVTRRIERRR
jgi:hypothetical protein